MLRYLRLSALIAVVLAFAGASEAGPCVRKVRRCPPAPCVPRPYEDGCQKPPGQLPRGPECRSLDRDWQNADIDPATGPQSRPDYLNFIKNAVNNDFQAKKVSLVTRNRVLASINKHSTDRNVDVTAPVSTCPPSWIGNSNDHIIVSATQSASAADSESAWQSVADKLEQGH